MKLLNWIDDIDKLNWNCLSEIIKIIKIIKKMI